MSKTLTFHVAKVPLTKVISTKMMRSKLALRESIICLFHFLFWMKEQAKFPDGSLWFSRWLWSYMLIELYILLLQGMALYENIKQTLLRSRLHQLYPWIHIILKITLFSFKLFHRQVGGLCNAPFKFLIKSQRRKLDTVKACCFYTISFNTRLTRKYKTRELH